MNSSDLLAKLAAMQRPENAQVLENAFRDYQDPRWVPVKGCKWNGVWRVFLFGFSCRFMNADVARFAQESFSQFKKSFEAHASHLQRQILALKPCDDATPFVHHDHDQIREVNQYLSLSGMPWHLAQRWNLLSMKKIRERVQEMEKEQAIWVPVLFSWFGENCQEKELNATEWAQLELFCWRAIAVKGMTWMELLEKWASGNEEKTSLLNNLKECFLFARCQNIFADRASLLLPPVQAPVPKAVEPPRAEVSKGLQRRGASRVHSDMLTMSPLDEPPADCPLMMPERTFTNMVGRARAIIKLIEKDSIKRFLIDQTIGELGRTDLALPQEQRGDLRTLLMGLEEAQIPKNCLSILEFAERFQALLNSESVETARRSAGTLLNSLLPLDKNPQLNHFFETTLLFSLIRIRIKRSPCALDDEWQELFFTCLTQMSSEEVSLLLKVADTLPVFPRPSVVSKASEVFRKLEEKQLFAPDRLASLFLHFLCMDARQSGETKYLQPLQIFELWQQIEDFLGVLQPPDTVYTLFSGAPISKEVLSAISSFAKRWRPDLLANFLFLPVSYLSQQSEFVKLLELGLVAAEPYPLAQEKRRCLVETLALATLAEDPAYRSVLLELKGLKHDQAALSGTSNASGLVTPLVKKLKSGPSSSFGRHFHCVSYWRYYEGQKGTRAKFECSLVSSLDWMRVATFDIELPEFLSVEVFQSDPQLAKLCQLLMRTLANESYRDGQKEVNTPINFDKISPATHHDLIKKALQALTYSEPFEVWNDYVYPNGESVDEQRLAKAVGIYQFILSVKRAFREAASSLVTEPARLPITQNYEMLNVQGRNEGWKFISNRNPPAFNQLVRAENQGVVDQLLAKIKTRQIDTSGYDLQAKLNGEAKTIRLMITISGEFQNDVRLDAQASLPDLPAISDHMQWPIACTDLQGKELLFLFLCKLAFNNKWTGENHGR